MIDIPSPVHDMVDEGLNPTSISPVFVSESPPVVINDTKESVTYSRNRETPDVTHISSPDYDLLNEDLNPTTISPSLISDPPPVTIIGSPGDVHKNASRTPETDISISILMSLMHFNGDQNLY